MPYGLLTTGFAVKPLEVLIEEMESDFKSEFNVTPTGRVKKTIAMVCDRYAELWEGLEAVNAASDPDAATSAALDTVCAFTGTLREASAPSTVTLTLTGTPTTLVPSGSRAATAETELEFQTAANATIAAVAAWNDATPYVVGDYVTNNDAGTDRVYICIDPGTSAGSGGPTGTGASIVDNTVIWRYVGDGTGAIGVAASSVANGVIAASSGDITEIVTPVSGWVSVLNLLDADEGRLEETDEELRIRRELELSASGTSPPDAIRAALLEVDEVTSVTVFYNDTDNTVDGMPPHSVEALVRGGDDQDIAECLFANVAAGIGTTGNAGLFTVQDSEGSYHDVVFSRPDEVEIYVDISVTYDALTYPDDGDAQIADAIVAWGDALRTGRDAVASAVSAQAFQVDGVLDVTDVDIGTTASPTTGATVAISTRQLAVFDTSRIVVVSTPGTP